MRIFFFIIAMWAHIAHAEFTFNDPSGQAPYLGELVDVVNRIIPTRSNVNVLVKPCGMENAFYQPQSKIIVYCLELKARAEQRMQSAAPAIQQGIVSQEAVIQGIIGEQVFVVLHEMGHAIIDVNRVPTFGREEDAADMFAAVIMLEADRPSAYFGALNFFNAKPRPGYLVGNRSMIDEHGLPQQRKANLACWGFGHSPQKMRSIVQHLGFDQVRLSRCPGEYQKMRRDFEQLFIKAS